ncbi:AAA family ATPase [Gracilibacillus salinarum]|uniref:Nuclease SbcCD subunit C n=1 Tax=Gracilibacillus salinarum TaxID=2932255 RepID=A0ABY4GN93_9BACI|nr:AAA family ATPase [Gracilibacillus salinarum]UOQ85668.1 AAA family ATPase [Gracilibacillus salinarum]
MQIKFKELKLNNFKSHQDLQVNFGEVTKITGDNAKGKSSVLEAISWLLYGIDTLGSKTDPAPVTYEADETMVSLLLDVDGKDLLLGRELKKGKTKYLINEVPSKATEFNEILDQLFDKNMFLSLFNPNYFFTMHWEKQREMILDYVTAPANKEVLKELPEAQSNKLAELVKKQSLADLEKIHCDKKNKLDKQYIAAQSRTKTLKEQFEDQAPKVPQESLQAELSQLTKQRNEIEKVTDEALTTNSEFNNIQSQINSLNDQIEMSKNRWPSIRDEKIERTCRTCKQPLDEKSVAAVEEDKEKRVATYKAEHSDIVNKRNALKKDLEELEYIDVAEELEKSRALQDKINPIEAELNKYKQLEAFQEQIEQAEQTEKQTRDDLNESIFILDSIKDFYAKEAELQAKKVQSLFDNLSIKLFKKQKNGDDKPTFEIQMDGKDYSKLSLSESIRAGLELREVLSDQSDIVAPVFVDNAESITKFKEPSGQLIMAKVIAGEELKIEEDK